MSRIAAASRVHFVAAQPISRHLPALPPVTFQQPIQTVNQPPRVKIQHARLVQARALVNDLKHASSDTPDKAVCMLEGLHHEKDHQSFARSFLSRRC